MTKIYRYEVPVDGKLHQIKLQGEILSVACRNHHIIEFWAYHFDNPIFERTRTFVVVGTGHEITYVHEHVGSAIAPSGYLVWHLLEIL